MCYYDKLKNNNDALTMNGESPAEWLMLINERIWQGDMQSPKIESCVLDMYRVQLLQLTSLLVSQYSAVVVPYKKEIIKFNWNFISLEDNIAKQAAYISTVHFICAFDTPAKVVIQVFVALLKANQSEIKFMVRQALDLLAPHLNERLKSDHEWINWTRRVLSEEGFVVTQVSNIYQFIVTHADLFYASRDQFIPNVITAMGKLTVINSSSHENQLLAIDLAEMILNWEFKARNEKLLSNEAEGESMEVDSEAVETHDSLKSSYSVPFGQRDTCITFLIRYVCICSQRASENELGRRALNILHILLSPNFWPDVSVQLNFFEKFLVNTDSNVSNLSLIHI